MDFLYAISPIDGRYSQQTQPLTTIASEFGLMHHRVRVEVQWLQALAQSPQITDCPTMTPAQIKALDTLVNHFSKEDAIRIKTIESGTNHDVKAVEYFLREKLSAIPTMETYLPFIHFACTSEDINNLAYAIMLQQCMTRVVFVQLHQMIRMLEEFTRPLTGIAMLSRTHGQPASPTTLGKEIANVIARLRRQIHQLLQHQYLGKINGAVGNFNAHMAAYPEADWPLIAQQFVEGLGLTYNPMTTQIEPHDMMADVFHNMMRVNTILLDFSRDIWGYIALGYFKQVVKKGEVGSSTMPHKVNPIDFENAEGNFGVANAMFTFLASKLPQSRFQRDLTDSTTLRNLGVGFAHSLIGYLALMRGIDKLDVNKTVILNDLNAHPEVLGEAIQTVMRRFGHENAYEQLKDFTRGNTVDLAALHAFIQQLQLPQASIDLLMALRPETYSGLAEYLARAELN